jgi:hypothetical protein
VIRRVASLLALAVAVCGSGRATAQPALGDPYRIFARASGFWYAQHYPPLLEYEVAVTVLEGGTFKAERYWSAYDSIDRKILVDPVSDYEKAHPTHAAHGMTIAIPILSSFIGKPQPPTDYLGVPELAPNYSFGMARIPATKPRATPNPMEIVAEVRAAFHDPMPKGRPTPKPSATPSTPPVIEEVTAYNRAYAVTLVGIETIEGATTYHLHLRACASRDATGSKISGSMRNRSRRCS